MRSYDVGRNHSDGNGCGSSAKAINDRWFSAGRVQGKLLSDGTSEGSSDSAGSARSGLTSDNLSRSRDGNNSLDLTSEANSGVVRDRRNTKELSECQAALGTEV